MRRANLWSSISETPQGRMLKNALRHVPVTFQLRSIEKGVLQNLAKSQNKTVNEILQETVREKIEDFLFQDILQSSPELREHYDNQLRPLKEIILDTNISKITFSPATKEKMKFLDNYQSLIKINLARRPKVA